MDEKTKKAEQGITALYCRLSRDDEQEGPSGSIKNQQKILESYARENGFRNLRFFVDDGYSGVSFVRPAFMELMELAQQRQISTLIVKDHSRLGRNRLVVGQLLEEEFDRLGIRYIAIMDNIDTAKGLSDLVPMQDLFNEWHAKNTSQKVRSVFHSKGMSGTALATTPPYGFVKDPDDPKAWRIDEAAAAVVRRIYAWCIEGLGPTQIARRLQQEGAPTPAEHRGPDAGCRQPNSPCHWCAATVADILARQEYLGHTVNFRTTRKSFKSKKKIDLPADNWRVFENTHPAIVDEESFYLVQRLRENRRRPTKSGIVSIFSGLLYCADCGKKLYYNYSNNYKKEQACFYCSTYRKDTANCTAHFIREYTLQQVVAAQLRQVFAYIQGQSPQQALQQLSQYSEARQRDDAEARRKLEGLRRRIAEIDTLFEKMYEDNASGRLSDERYDRMANDFETEQRALSARAAQLEHALQADSDQLRHLRHFIEQVNAAGPFTELTPELLHAFVERIIVFAPDRSSGHRTQQLQIHYAGAGVLDHLVTLDAPEE